MTRRASACPVMAAGVLLLGLAGASMLPAAALPRGAAEGPRLDAVRRSPAFRRLYLAVQLVSMPAALPVENSFGKLPSATFSTWTTSHSWPLAEWTVDRIR